VGGLDNRIWCTLRTKIDITIGSTVSVNNAFRKRASDDIIIALAAVDQIYYTNTVIHTYTQTYTYTDLYIIGVLYEYQCIVH